jgi:peptidoglycan/LPS O-acetylase OafA/YrhL
MDRGSSSCQPIAKRVPNAFSQGLRGIAAVMVVTSHVFRVFAYGMLMPVPDDGSPPSIWQQVPLRLHCQGSTWVAVFFVLTGYVNCLKPIANSRAGEYTNLFTDLSKAAFKRTGRLVLPTTCA